MANESGVSTSNRVEPVVICIGETMLMLAPPANELIEYSPGFTSLLGGAEVNVAIGLERLGVHTGWIGKLPRNALGRKIVNETRSFGIDTSAVVWTDEGRVGLFFVEWGAKPRRINTIYDRANSAATTLTADELDWQYILGARCVHLTGINLALSETCRNTTHDIAVRARARGVRVSFDVNYRSLLWSPDEARAALAEVLLDVDLLVATESDVAMLLEKALPREDALRCLHERYSLDAAVMTLGGDGSLAFDGERFCRSYGYSVQAVNRLGAGDAFVAGLLYGYLRSDLQLGLDYGSAMAALKMTIPQNTPLVSKDDVERLMDGHEAALCFTSPPYNAGDNALGGNKSRVDSKYLHDDDDRPQDEYRQFLERFTAIAANVMNSRYEDVWILSPDTYPKRSIPTGRFHSTVPNVYEGRGASGENTEKAVHAATMPMHFAVHCLQSFDGTGGVVYEPFCGSGTTVIAAEKLKRRCFAMEIDPVYCDIAVKRYEDFSGKKAVRYGKA